MNAVEIEEAVSKLAEQSFEAAAFPYAFLEAFGNKANTIKRLRSAGKSTTNKTDVGGDGVVAALQRNNIHVAALNPVAEVAKTSGPDAVGDLLKQLTGSPATAKHKAKFALATDGEYIQAENLNTGETLVCDYAELADHFGFFLELAGISTVRQIRENAFDIKATGRLNRLYVELLRHNPDWDGDEHREHLNHFFARLIFCFFAEDTGIFHGNGLFTETVRQMSESSGKNTNFVLAEIFRAMDVPMKDRDAAGLRSWAGQFPYVNGGLFGNQPLTPSPSPQGDRPASKVQSQPDSHTLPQAGGSDAVAAGEGSSSKPPIIEPSPLVPRDPPASGRVRKGEGLSSPVPKFTQIARSYLLHIGSLDWTRINPDIFGSMIQAVAEDEERGALGMHYTSVPNILKVLNPLFLDELRTQLDEAGNNRRKLLNLRKRLARIRVFDPACGSGNFLVIAYKQMREIEAEINRRRGEADRATDIPLTNFRGIEIRHFAAEVARLALVIAEYQCDELHRGQRLALAEFLSLDNQNWITHGNALRLDWLKVCPPTGTGGVKLTEDDLFQMPLEQTEIDFENEGGETYICGNPPYKGNADQNKGQKDDIRHCFTETNFNWKSLDYICGWFWKAKEYTTATAAYFAFVSTNSISQGQNISYFWKHFLAEGIHIEFALRSFRWKNLASENATVTVVVIGCSRSDTRARFIVEEDSRQVVSNINPYLIPGDDVFVDRSTTQMAGLASMIKGNYYGLSEGLLLSMRDKDEMLRAGLPRENIRRFRGGAELVKGSQRACLWFPSDDLPSNAAELPEVVTRIEAVRQSRKKSPDKMAVRMAETPHQFREMNCSRHMSIAVPNVSSEGRGYIPVTLEDEDVVFPNTAFALYDADLFNLALIASRMHYVWVLTVCGKLETRIRYSNTLGWNTFPVPTLSDKNKADLTRCAEDILLAREAHWPATIAQLYDPEKMPDDLRAAHDRNDDTLERIYIGRRFKNDTERLETLFQMYTEMTAKEGKA